MDASVDRERQPAERVDGAQAAEEAEVTSLMSLAERAARRAGELVHRRRPARLEVTTKSTPTDVVTEMDRAAEDLLRQILLQARPGDALLGEEAGLQPGSSGLTWVLDPIDGTVNYLYGLHEYVVSVAVVRGDAQADGGFEPVAGCVHAPATGETWTAGAGAGAFLDGRRLALGQPPALAQALIGTGFGYAAQRRAEQAQVVAALLPQVRDIRRIGCAALDLCLVATGRLDGYYERGLHPWDLAAGLLIVREAGATVTGLGGRPPGEGMVVAARDPLAAALRSRLEELDADGRNGQ